MTPKPLKPPAHLSQEMKKWWRVVTSDFDLDEHHKFLLQLAAEAYDIGQRARLEMVGQPLTFVDRNGQPKPQPQIGIERDARISMARLLRDLALDCDEPSDATRPLPIHGNANRRRA